jgi:hypothetical protein
MNISPHLLKLNERIVIDGFSVGDDFFNRYGELIKNVSEKDSKYIDGYVAEINKIASEQKGNLTLDSNITLSGGKRKTQRRKKLTKKSKSMKRSQRK